MNSTDSMGRLMNNGLSIPRVGLGVFQAAQGEQTTQSVQTAIRLGYRHIDTAKIYGNEREVGVAVRASGVPREQLYITTKLWNSDQGYDKALKAFDQSLAQLGLEYVDLYLLHWPVAGRRLDSWRALESIHQSGRAKSIGVSNFMVRHLSELLEHAKVVPAVNQIELSPFLQQREVCDFCEKHHIVLEAYSPLTRGTKLSDPTVLRVANEVQRTAAQVLLRWGLQKNFVVLPKSTQSKRLAENFALFDFALTPSQMAVLDGLEMGWVTGWDPRNAP